MRCWIPNLDFPEMSIAQYKKSLIYLKYIYLLSLFFTDLGIVILIMALLGRFFATSAYVIFALFTSELFPTVIRNTAIGASLTMSHVGTFISPYIVDILVRYYSIGQWFSIFYELHKNVFFWIFQQGAYRWYIPSTIFGLFSIMSIFFVCFLPETKNKPSYNNIEEMVSSNESRLTS